MSPRGMRSYVPQNLHKTFMELFILAPKRLPKCPPTMSKSSVIYEYSGILFNHKKEEILIPYTTDDVHE